MVVVAVLEIVKTWKSTHNLKNVHWISLTASLSVLDK